MLARLWEAAWCADELGAMCIFGNQLMLLLPFPCSPVMPVALSILTSFVVAEIFFTVYE
jgi:hypothetical protein